MKHLKLSEEDILFKGERTRLYLSGQQLDQVQRLDVLTPNGKSIFLSFKNYSSTVQISNAIPLQRSVE